MKIKGLRYWTKNLQVVIAISFTLISVIGMLSIGIILYSTYIRNSEKQTVQDNSQLMRQVELNLTNYLRNMMRISDSLYYSVIKDTDFAQESIDKEMTLLYEANRDNLVSIACFSSKGELIASTPVSTLKEGVDVTLQSWFIKAQNKPENHHFSSSHVQNIFVDSNDRYYWVLSLSRGIELTYEGRTTSGILLVDMNFNGIEQLFTKVNGDGISYMYLINQEGDIIYHPQQNLINSSLYQENNKAAAGYEDGTQEEIFEGKERIINVKTVGYTGWKIVSVIPRESIHKNWSQINAVWITVLAIAILILIFVNQYISTRITQPLRRLETSVLQLKLEHPENIYVGGSEEIRHLGETLRFMVKQLRELMADVVHQQEEKRKNELDALQSQINPHFLYNTLESIIWMIESERYDEAISMVTSLANLFRISISQGRTIITIEEEFQHAQHYISIQKVRYKNKFSVYFCLKDEIKDCPTIKLIIQPILENAIYYGMEAMDGEGEIMVQGYAHDEEIYIDVTDNGIGMPKEQVEKLLTKGDSPRKRGSGIGLKNTNQRIKLYYGEKYGLRIKSVPDTGTRVRICIPLQREVKENDK